MGRFVKGFRWEWYGDAENLIYDRSAGTWDAKSQVVGQVNTALENACINPSGTTWTYMQLMEGREADHGYGGTEWEDDG